MHKSCPIAWPLGKHLPPVVPVMYVHTYISACVVYTQMHYMCMCVFHMHRYFYLCIIPLVSTYGYDCMPVCHIL